jgi:uncharacterized protein YdeI (BOF family)
MQSIKRDLSFGLTASALVFACALAWGSPFVGTESRAAARQEPQQAQAPQDETKASKSATFTGTVVKSGDQFILRDSSGQVYKLDDAESAKPYEGKAVKITGKLDEQAKLIHVESIEGTEA